MEKPKLILIKSLIHLVRMIEEGHTNYTIMLAGGLIRSSKKIRYDSKTHKFRIFNSIDDTEQILTVKEVLNPKLTNIGKAITLQALYMYT
ncbi:MAG: hypothetical protein WCX46_02415 [Candidatus Paceibacterota bacterium]